MIKPGYLEEWVKNIIRHPVTKLPVNINKVHTINGFADFRTLLKNTLGFKNWETGQKFFENWEENGVGYSRGAGAYLEEIEADAEIYNEFTLAGNVLDVGGLSGTVRHFLPNNSKYVCLDPFENAPHAFTPEKMEAYKCLSSPYNFVVGNAEFLPFKENSFDYIHMRSMLDHVQVPDLAILEAHRVLVKGGNLLVGMTVEGGKDGKMSAWEQLKDIIRGFLGVAGIKRFVDHHTWHPTYAGLVKLAEDNGFLETRHIWQSKWKGRVVYVLFEKLG